MEGHHYGVLWSIGIISISCMTILRLYKRGQLMTPTGGAHFQIFVFFGVGGLVLSLLSSSDPRLSEPEVHYFGDLALQVFFFGYIISFVSQRILCFVISADRSARDLRPLIGGATNVALALVSLSIISIGFLFPGVTFGAIQVYLGTLFYPTLFLSIVNFHFYSFNGRMACILLFVVTLFFGFYSPWRSFLVVTMVTCGLGVAVQYKRLIPWAAVGLGIGLLVVFPFQLLKRADLAQFQADPIGLFSKTLTIGTDERLEMLGSFFVVRLSYARELVYVTRALEFGLLEKQYGETYAAIIYQIIPRFIWPEKPELARWAGFDLPRRVGLLESTDLSTSWAVNPFAEACYNFGLSGLLWFIPVFFAFISLLEFTANSIYRDNRSKRLASICLFFAILSMTTVIFGFTVVVSIFIIVKFADFFWVNQAR